MKKKSLLIVVLLLVISLTIGASYALWQATHKQESKNVVSIGCFNLESDIGTEGEQAPISLMDAMPISDESGMSLTPFTFTITNTCNMYAAYQVNLETLSATTLGPDYLKVALSNNTPALLSSYLSVSPTITGANASNKLISGGLRQGESITYDLRLWLDESTPRDAGSNKIYNGKISIVASPSIYVPTAVEVITNIVEGEPSNTIDVITVASPNGATCTNTLAYDNTTDNNLRYVGSDPCNYVSFNNETWRIIGVMNNVDDGSGKKESRLKLIRNESLGNYSWDLSVLTVNDGYGINQWGTTDTYEGADLMRELNTDYLNPNLASNPMWYGYQSGYSDSNYISGYGQVVEFDKTKALSTNAQDLIGDAVWYTGAYNDTNVSNAVIIVSAAYQNERSNNPNATNIGKYCPNENYSCSDEILRLYDWIGKVGLIYPSDYGYAVGGATRSTCLTNNLSSFSTNDCSQNSWINNGSWQWSLSPYAEHISATYVGGFYMNVGAGSAISHNSVRPSLYLKSSVKITGGDGSIDNPYTLGV